MNAILNIMSAHRSIRKFKDKPISQSTFQTMVTAAQCAATSNHIQSYTLIRVTDKAVRKEIADLSGPQPWVEQAPEFLVFCADLTRLIRACKAQGKTETTGWAEQMLVATVDAALIAQNLMLAAESMALGGVFIGGIRNDPETISTLLDIPNHAFPVFGMCLGYPDHAPDIKPRLPLDLILKEDTFHGNNKKEAEDNLDAYDKVMRDYYRNRDSNLKDDTWSRQMANFISRGNRPHMKSFLEKKGFFTR